MLFFRVFFSFLFLMATTSLADEVPTEKEATCYFVCGEEIQEPECRCEDDGVMTCESGGKDEKWFETTNVLIMKSNYAPKNVTFQNAQIIKLQKDHVLPGREATVESLVIVSQNLTVIEDGVFDSFDSLKSLALIRTGVTKISDKVFTEKLGASLAELDLSYGNLTSLDSIDLKNLKNLKSLSLMKNHRINFTASSAVFPKELEKLESLNLEYCNIEVLNEDIFINLPNLKTLNLGYNGIKSIPKVINHLPNLKTLNLHATFIQTLNNSGIAINENLEKLVIANCLKLTAIEDCAFCSFPNLKTLHLWDNHQLTFIHNNSFGYASNGTSPKIESFSLEHGHLETIPEKLLNWSSVKEIGIGGNYFVCNCSMAWLVNAIDSFNLVTIHDSSFEWNTRENNLKCYGPMALKNVHFSDISGNLCQSKDQHHHHDEETEHSTLPGHPMMYFFFGMFVASLFISAIAIPAYYYYVKKENIFAGLSFGNSNYDNEISVVRNPIP